MRCHAVPDALHVEEIQPPCRLPELRLPRTLRHGHAPSRRIITISDNDLSGAQPGIVRVTSIYYI